jgi:hypothetical protein
MSRQFLKLQGIGPHLITRISAGRKIINVFDGLPLGFPGEAAFPAPNR